MNNLYEYRRSIESRVYKCLNDDSSLEGLKDDITYHMDKLDDAFFNDDDISEKFYLDVLDNLLTKGGY